MAYQELLRTGYIPTSFHAGSFKFAFVRNPYDRAVSLYHQLLRQRHLETDMTFKSFLRTLVKEGCQPIGLYNVREWSQCNPQIRWTEGVKLDYLGRFESIGPDLNRVCSDLGLPPRPFLPQLNKSSSKDKITRYYDEEAIEMVSYFYREDFEAFGYDRELPTR